MSFYYIYLLHTFKDSQFYTGFTQDLRQRVHEHNAGKNVSTKHRRPLELVFYEAFLSKLDALKRERYLKTTKGKAVLKNMLRNFLKPKSK